MNINILRRFIIICAISTFIMFTFWAVYKSFVNRPPGDYETEVCDNRLKDKMWDKAIQAANDALIKNPQHRGAMMCEAIANINKNEYNLASQQLSELISFLNKTLVKDDLTGRGTLAAAYANRGIIKDRKGDYEGALKDYIKSLETDAEAVEGPGLGEKILYMINKPSSIRKRAQYIYEQLKLPEDQRVLSVPDRDKEQIMHKPGKL